MILGNRQLDPHNLIGVITYCYGFADEEDTTELIVLKATGGASGSGHDTAAMAWPKGALCFYEMMFYYTLGDNWTRTTRSLYDHIQVPVREPKWIGPDGSLEASDPRDLIFSLHGIHHMPKTLTPDYRLSVAELFGRASRHFVTSNGNLGILQYCNGVVSGSPLQSHGPPLPSWVYDFSQPIKRLPIDTMRSDHPRDWGSACRNYSLRLVNNVECGVLNVQGKNVDHLLAVFAFDLDHFYERVFSFVPDCFELVSMVEQAKQYRSIVQREITEKRILWTLTGGVPGWRYRICRRSQDEEADRGKREIWGVNRGDLWQCYERRRDYRSQSPEPEDKFQRRLRHSRIIHRHRLESLSRDVALHTQDMKRVKRDRTDLKDLAWGTRVAINRRLAITAGGSLALVPSSAIRGDIVAILHSADSPMVLREASSTKTGDQTYRFVGPAYIEGMMRGQAVYWKEGEADDINLE